MSKPYAVQEVVENVPFGFGTGQKAEVRRWLLTKGGKTVQVVNKNLGAVPLLFDDQELAEDFAAALNGARKGKK